MATARVYVRIECGGEILDKRWTREGGRAPSYKWEIPAATPGTLTTRSSPSEGVITVASHTLTTSDIVDIYWTKADGSLGLRFGNDISGATGTTITFEDGEGDDLPDDESPVIICKARLANLDLRRVALAGKMQAICPDYLNTSTAKAAIVRQFSLGGSRRRAKWLANANQIKFLDFENNRETWNPDSGTQALDNLFDRYQDSGDLVATRYSHNDTTQACTLYFVGIEATT